MRGAWIIRVTIVERTRVQNMLRHNLAAVVFAVLISASQVLLACPFCSSVSQTFTEEIKSMDAVVIARLVKPPSIKELEDDQAVPKAKFEIVQVIRGGDVINSKKELIETVYYGREKVGKRFLLMAVDPPRLMWSTPLTLSERAQKYVAKIVNLPEKGVSRVRFFLDYLEDKDEMLARDAYDEFAKAPYDDVKAVKSDIDRKQLITWIKDPNIPASRRRLYFTLLGVCGDKSDLSFLESLLRSGDSKSKAGLDAMIACYLTIGGPDGMPLIEELFLKNKKAPYSDTYAAIMALRFHGGQNDVVPRKRVVQAMHHMLSRPQLADLVIPDLAGWEDWSQVDRCVELFKSADEKSSWVKVPVINYLRACPLPDAKLRLKELEKIDPAAVKRANTFFPLGTPKSPTATESTQAAPAPNPMAPEIEPVQTIPVQAPAAAPAEFEQVAEVRRETTVEAPKRIALTQPSTSGVEVAQSGAAILAQSAPNHWLTAAMFLSIGTLMLWMMWSILSGAGQRSPY